MCFTLPLFTTSSSDLLFSLAPAAQQATPLVPPHAISTDSLPGQRCRNFFSFFRYRFFFTRHSLAVPFLFRFHQAEFPLSSCSRPRPLIASALLPVDPPLVDDSSPKERENRPTSRLLPSVAQAHDDVLMPVQLLPASAAAFAPRASSVNVVLGSKVEPWLTQTLKRTNRAKRLLNSVPQHQRCLTETLSSPNATWTLASLMLPKVPDAEMPKDPQEALFSYQMVHVEAYVVHVDMVLRNEVAYKLTSDTIDALIEYHENIHCVDAKANTYDWSEKEQQCKKLHEDFVQAINKFVYRTHVKALEGLEEEGTGELLDGKSQEVKTALLGLMKRLLPPPPRIVDVVRQPTLLPNSPVNNNMWSQPPVPSPLPAVDAWRILPSSPSIASTSADSTPIWANMAMSDVQISPPAPAFADPHASAAMYFSSPPMTAPMSAALPLPSMLASSQCGISVGMGGFDWSRFQEYAAII